MKSVNVKEVLHEESLIGKTSLDCRHATVVTCNWDGACIALEVQTCDRCKLAMSDRVIGLRGLMNLKRCSKSWTCARVWQSLECCVNPCMSCMIAMFEKAKVTVGEDKARTIKWRKNVSKHLMLRSSLRVLCQWDRMIWDNLMTNPKKYRNC